LVSKVLFGKGLLDAWEDGGRRRKRRSRRIDKEQLGYGRNENAIRQ